MVQSLKPSLDFRRSVLSSLYPPIMMCGFVQKKQKENISALFVILKKRMPDIMGQEIFIVRLCYSTAL